MTTSDTAATEYDYETYLVENTGIARIFDQHELWESGTFSLAALNLLLLPAQELVGIAYRVRHEKTVSDVIWRDFELALKELQDGRVILATMRRGQKFSELGADPSVDTPSDNVDV